MRARVSGPASEAAGAQIRHREAGGLADHRVGPRQHLLGAGGPGEDGDRDSADRALFTEWLIGNKTGDERIRAGLPAGWRVGDKTGTGRYGTANDVAVVWPPGRPPIALAVLTSRATEDAPRDNALLAQAAAVVAHELG